MSQSVNNSGTKGTILLLFLLITAVIAIGFTPAMNPNVAAGMYTISNSQLAPATATTNVIFDTFKYGRSIDILAMLLAGFGFLMVCVRKHGYSSITATFLVVSIAIPLYMLIKSFGGPHFAMPTTSIDTLICGEFAAASLLIAIGAPLGRLKMEQYFLMALLFVPAYILNEWLILYSGLFPNFLDTGGSVVIHAFGAYFGLGVVATTLSRFKEGPEADSVSNQFSLLGGIVLWLFWPSFTSALVTPDKVVLTVINTVLALCGATLTTYIFSKQIRGKIEIADIANAALAGGVAIGSICNMTNPGYAMLIGIVAGGLSTVGFAIVAPKLEKFIKGTDTCGVHNLHGMPGVLGGITGILVTGAVGSQLGGIVTTVVLAFITGRVTGMALDLLGTKAVLYSDTEEFFVTDSAGEFASEAPETIPGWDPAVTVSSKN